MKSRKRVNSKSFSRVLLGLLVDRWKLSLNLLSPSFWPLLQPSKAWRMMPPLTLRTAAFLLSENPSLGLRQRRVKLGLRWWQRSSTMLASTSRSCFFQALSLFEFLHSDPWIWQPLWVTCGSCWILFYSSSLINNFSLQAIKIQMSYSLMQSPRIVSYTHPYIWHYLFEV